MAGRPKQPINLIIAKGKKHLTKQEINKRKENEVKVNYTDIKVPEYLSEREQMEFCKIAEILLNVGIMTELDEDCLARYLIAQTNYVQYTNELRKLNKKLLIKQDALLQDGFYIIVMMGWLSREKLGRNKL